MELLDIHTHHAAPQPHGVISLGLRPGEPVPVLDPDQRYSAGIHPWDTLEEPSEEDWARLERLASRPEVVAIGETGIDLSPKGGPLFRQMQVFKRHIDLSERIRKPLVIHAVKGDDIIVGLRRDLKPSMPWAIHGFRRKAEVAEMLIRSGCYLSFGQWFNPEAVRVSVPERILAETDTSEAGIEAVISALSEAVGEDVRALIARNTDAFLRGTGIGNRKPGIDK